MSTLAPGMRVTEQYALQSRLGEGAFGEVWSATDLSLDRTVAIKFLRREVVQTLPPAQQEQVLARFEGEARALAKIHHPNVVQVLNIGQWGDLRFIVMEHVAGLTLSQWLGGFRARQMRPDWNLARDLVLQICRGVTAIHRAVREPRPIVHRDLKPENILVVTDASGALHIKVVDLGIAQQGDHRYTSAGFVLGTPDYMAPEQTMGDVSRTGPWTDVFALGALFAELVSGHPPPTGDNRWCLLAMRSEPEVTNLLMRLQQGEPPGFWMALASALKSNPQERPMDAGQLLQLLDASLQAPRASGTQMFQFAEVTAEGHVRVSAPNQSYVPPPPQQQGIGAVAIIAILGVMGVLMIGATAVGYKILRDRDRERRDDAASTTDNLRERRDPSFAAARTFTDVPSPAVIPNDPSLAGPMPPPPPPPPEIGTEVPPPPAVPEVNCVGTWSGPAPYSDGHPERATLVIDNMNPTRCGHASIFEGGGVNTNNRYQLRTCTLEGNTLRMQATGIGSTYNRTFWLNCGTDTPGVFRTSFYSPAMSRSYVTRGTLTRRP